MSDISELQKEKLLGIIKTEFKRFVDGIEQEYNVKIEKNYSGNYDVLLPKINKLFDEQNVTKNIIGKL